MKATIFNIRRRKVGGIWFLRIGRLQFSFCLCRSYAKQEKRGAKPAHSSGRNIVIEAPYVRRYPGGSTVVVYDDR